MGQVCLYLAVLAKVRCHLLNVIELIADLGDGKRQKIEKSAVKLPVIRTGDMEHIVYRQQHADDKAQRKDKKQLGAQPPIRKGFPLFHWSSAPFPGAQPSLVINYTMPPRSGLNKTAPPAVLQGSMFSKPCAPAQGRVPCTRAAAQAAALRL